MITSFLLGAGNASTIIQNSAGAACSTACNTTSLDALFGSITSTLVYLVGAISVIMTVVGGLRYVTSNGDAKRVADAKNTVMYSIVGVVLALLAYAIIKFVATRL